MDQTVVTIYCCGTNFSRDNKDEAVAYSWANTKGDRVWINDGPGNTQHPILKSEQILKKAEKGKGIKDKLFSKRRTHKLKVNSDSLGGGGTQDNIVTTLQWLWMEYYRKDKPAFKTVNLCGWSRGAVTCIMLAHAIEGAGFRDLIPDLKVNLFCFDPVPGSAHDFDVSGSFDATGRIGSPEQLPPVVNEYAAVLMEHEGGLKGALFKCVSPRISSSELPQNGGQSNGRKIEYPMPGNHADPVKFAKPDNPVGRISLALCHEFLLRHGTAIEAPQRLPEKRIVELYAEAYMKFSKAGKNGPRTKRETTSNRSAIIVNEMRGDAFFLNGHHYGLFAKLAPTAIAQIKALGQVGAQEEQRLRGDLPRSHEGLAAAGLIAG